MDLNDFQDMDQDFNEDKSETKIVFKNSVQKNELKISEEELHSLYLSFDIDFNEINRKYGLWRFHVIHIRGVQDMSSEDVLKYFEEFDPNSIEWVNDLSCNVVFNDNKSAAIAMKGLTTSLVIKMSKQTVNNDIDVQVIDADSLPVPIPPQFRWRLGKTVSKSKALLLRFATNKDKKMLGSRPLSQYYFKYGVPEDSSEKNLNSERKRRYNSNEINDSNHNRSDSSFDLRTKRFRMKADDEQQLIQNRKTSKLSPIESTKNERKSIWDRLDNDSFGNFCAVDTDLLEIAINDKTNSSKTFRQNPLNSLRSSVSMSQSYKSVSNKNDLRTKIRKNSF